MKHSSFHDSEPFLLAHLEQGIPRFLKAIENDILRESISLKSQMPSLLIVFVL
jgi:hypothetical protein